MSIATLAEHRDVEPDELGLAWDDWRPDEYLRVERVSDAPPAYRFRRFWRGETYPAFDPEVPWPLEALPPRLRGLESGRMAAERLNRALGEGRDHGWWDEYERLLDEFEDVIQQDQVPERTRDMLPFIGGVRVVLDARGQEWLLKEVSV